MRALPRVSSDSSCHEQDANTCKTEEAKSAWRGIGHVRGFEARVSRLAHVWQRGIESCGRYLGRVSLVDLVPRALMAEKVAHAERALRCAGGACKIGARCGRDVGEIGRNLGEIGMWRGIKGRVSARSGAPLVGRCN